MSLVYELGTLASVFGAGVWLLRKPIKRGVVIARDAWRDDPIKMTSKVVVSLAAGQSIGWLIGYDQLGLFMDTKKQFGIGAEVATAIVRYLPESTTVYGAIKALEILADAARIPIEGALFRRYQIVPDALAAVVTQPLWTTFEVAEKVSGVILHPERVNDPDQAIVSLACVYGSVFRIAVSLVIWKKGDSIYRYLGQPLEHGLKRIFGRA